MGNVHFIRSLCVCDLVTASSNWNWDQIHILFPQHILKHIVGVVPPINEAGQDSLAWKWSNNGDFSSSELYKNMFTQGMEALASWDMIWSIRAPQRVCVLFWILWIGNLLTNVERRKRHMTDDAKCPLCASSLESISHALRDCSFAANIWKNVIRKQVHNLFFSLSFLDWLT